jgi:hypothetical protein
MAYQSTVWIGGVAALCPSQDTAGDGTTTLTDFTGVSSGILTNMDAATDWVTDDSKRCLDFDGTNDHVITPSTPIAGAKCLAFSAKFRRLVNTGNGFAAGFGPSVTTTSHQFIIYHFNDGNMYIHCGGLNFGFCAVSLTNQSWRSVIVHFNGSQATNATRLKVWLDGTLQTLSFSGTIPAQLPIGDASRLFLGVSPYASPLYGVCRVDDVRANLRLWSDAERVEIDASRGGTYAVASTSRPSSPFLSQVIG